MGKKAWLQAALRFKIKTGNKHQNIDNITESEFKQEFKTLFGADIRIPGLEEQSKVIIHCFNHDDPYPDFGVTLLWKDNHLRVLYGCFACPLKGFKTLGGFINVAKKGIIRYQGSRNSGTNKHYYKTTNSRIALITRPPIEQIKASHQQAASYRAAVNSPACLSYLKQRGLPVDIINNGAFGYDRHRNMIVYISADYAFNPQQPVCFAFRGITNNKKLKSPGMDYWPFWASVSLPAIKRAKKVVLVEGYLDAPSVWLAGCPFVIAMNTSKLTNHFLSLLLDLIKAGHLNHIYVWNDSDEAGVKDSQDNISKIESAISRLGIKQIITVTNIYTPEVKDPNDALLRCELWGILLRKKLL